MDNFLRLVDKLIHAVENRTSGCEFGLWISGVKMWISSENVDKSIKAVRSEELGVRSWRPERGVKSRIAGGITSSTAKRSPFPYEGKDLTRLKFR